MQELPKISTSQLEQKLLSKYKQAKVKTDKPTTLIDSTNFQIRQPYYYHQRSCIKVGCKCLYHRMLKNQYRAQIHKRMKSQPDYSTIKINQFPNQFLLCGPQNTDRIVYPQQKHAYLQKKYLNKQKKSCFDENQQNKQKKQIINTKKQMIINKDQKDVQQLAKKFQYSQNSPKKTQFKEKKQFNKKASAQNYQKSKTEKQNFHINMKQKRINIKYRQSQMKKKQVNSSLNKKNSNLMNSSLGNSISKWIKIGAQSRKAQYPKIKKINRVVQLQQMISINDLLSSLVGNQQKRRFLTQQQLLRIAKLKMNQFNVSSDLILEVILQNIKTKQLTIQQAENIIQQQLKKLIAILQKEQGIQDADQKIKIINQLSHRIQIALQKQIQRKAFNKSGTLRTIKKMTRVYQRQQVSDQQFDPQQYTEQVQSCQRNSQQLDATSILRIQQNQQKTDTFSHFKEKNSKVSSLRKKQLLSRNSISSFSSKDKQMQVTALGKLRYDNLQKLKRMSQILRIQSYQPERKSLNLSIKSEQKITSLKNLHQLVRRDSLKKTTILRNNFYVKRLSLARRKLTRNKVVISKLQRALAQCGLQCMIISNNDYVLTKKRKIRALKQFIEQKRQSFSIPQIKFIDELTEYIELHDQLCYLSIKNHKYRKGIGNRADTIEQESQEDISLDYQLLDFLKEDPNLKFYLISKQQKDTQQDELTFDLNHQYLTYRNRRNTLKTVNFSQNLRIQTKEKQNELKEIDNLLIQKDMRNNSIIYEYNNNNIQDYFRDVIVSNSINSKIIKFERSSEQIRKIFSFAFQKHPNTMQSLLDLSQIDKQNSENF